MTFAKSLPSPQIPKVWYYYNREGISICSEPIDYYPCTSEIHIVGSKYYYPYYIWYTFQKNGTKLNYEIWFNFNNTESILLANEKCDGNSYVKPINSTIFEKMDTNFNLTFNHYCDYQNNLVDFTIQQETFVQHKLQSNFTLIAFSNWKPKEFNATHYNTYFPIMEIHKTPPSIYDVCKYCNINK